jgi:hypothetical protein
MRKMDACLYVRPGDRQAWIAERNARPKPFKWTATADTILEKVARARRALE